MLTSFCIFLSTYFTLVLAPTLITFCLGVPLLLVVKFQRQIVNLTVTLRFYTLWYGSFVLTIFTIFYFFFLGYLSLSRLWDLIPVVMEVRGGGIIASAKKIVSEILATPAPATPPGKPKPATDYLVIAKKVKNPVLLDLQGGHYSIIRKMNLFGKFPAVSISVLTGNSAPVLVIPPETTGFELMTKKAYNAAVPPNYPIYPNYIVVPKSPPVTQNVNLPFFMHYANFIKYYKPEDSSLLALSKLDPIHKQGLGFPSNQEVTFLLPCPDESFLPVLIQTRTLDGLPINTLEEGFSIDRTRELYPFLTDDQIGQLIEYIRLEDKKLFLKEVSPNFGKDEGSAWDDLLLESTFVPTKEFNSASIALESKECNSSSSARESRD